MPFVFDRFNKLLHLRFWRVLLLLLFLCNTFSSFFSISLAPASIDERWSSSSFRWHYICCLRDVVGRALPLQWSAITATLCFNRCPFLPPPFASFHLLISSQPQLVQTSWLLTVVFSVSFSFTGRVLFHRRRQSSPRATTTTNTSSVCLIFLWMVATKSKQEKSHPSIKWGAMADESRRARMCQLCLARLISSIPKRSADRHFLPKRQQLVELSLTAISVVIYGGLCHGETSSSIAHCTAQMQGDASSTFRTF